LVTAEVAGADWRVRVAESLAEPATLAKESANFQMKPTPTTSSADPIASWREGSMTIWSSPWRSRHGVDRRSDSMDDAERVKRRTCPLG
jgi:hypothetical protein